MRDLTNNLPYESVYDELQPLPPADNNALDNSIIQYYVDSMTSRYLPFCTITQPATAMSVGLELRHV
jgi:hypothetical protein